MFFPNKFEGRNYFDSSTGWELEDISGWLFDNNEIDLIKRFIVIQGSQSEDSFQIIIIERFGSLTTLVN